VANHTSQDLSSVIADPKLSAAMVPEADSPAVSRVAASVHSTRDFLGRLRTVSATGKVDAGAIAYAFDNAAPTTRTVPGGPSLSTRL